MREVGEVGDFILVSDGSWMGTKDREGRIHISPELHYRDIHNMVDGVGVACQMDKKTRGSVWGLIDTEGRHISEFKYNFVEEWGDGYYRCDIGARSNILRRDGTEVLSEWFNDVFKVVNGYFMIGNTIRKSKNNPQTRYMRGLAHVNGDIIFPPIFESVEWVDDVRCEQLYGELDGQPYVLLLDGGIYDPQRAHLPLKKDATSADGNFVDREGDTQEDNFPWDGPEGTICEGCIYAKGIPQGAKGCGRLFQKSFRINVIKGECDFRKTDLFKPSVFETRRKEEMEKAKLKEAQVSGKFAKSLVLDFIRDKLHGDITNLKTFDFEQLRDDAKYGYCRGRAFSADYTPIVRAVMSLVFTEAWPEMTYDSFENYKYSIGTLNTFMMLFGQPFRDNFRGLENYRPAAEMLDRVWAFYHQCHTIDGIHRCLADNQGLIAVEHGVTRYDKHYVYSIVKSLREPSGVTYNLTMHIKKQGQAVCIRGSYDERGTTGIREANVFDYCKRYNLVRHDRKKELIGWSRDPYDETYTKGVRMNRSELQEFDHSYPEHPLSMLRKFIADIIDVN